MLNKDRFLQMAQGYGIDAAPIFEQLNLYAKILVRENEKVNLTSIVDPQQMEEKHFLDCLLFAKEEKVAGSLVDVGTGAGFPGVVAKLYKPELSLSLMDPTGKRINFLKNLCAELGIEAQFIKERAEEAARKEWREGFDVATARAVAAMPELCEYCLPLVKVGGVFIAMKGAKEEQAGSAIKTLGGKYLAEKEYALPSGDARRLIFIEKVKETPAAYPRNGGKIAKKPL